MKNKLSLIDTHCHLSMISHDTEKIVHDALLNNIDICIDVATRKEDWPIITHNVKKFASVYGSIGVHPNYAHQVGYLTYEDITQNVTHNKIVAIGETGLDYKYGTQHKEIQKKIFMEHILAAQKLNLPVIVHTRDADKDIVKCLQEGMLRQKFQAVIHCFSSSLYLAEEALNLGCFISLSGIITFDNDAKWTRIIKYFPIDRILLETDAPFLAPVPLRGQANHPKHIIHTAQKLAEIRELDLLQVTRITKKNATRLFSLDKSY